MRSISAERVDQRAPEPVELEHDDAAGLARLDARHHRVELRPVDRAAGHVELFVHACDAVAVRRRPGGDPLALHGGLNEGVAGPAADLADSHVGVKNHA